MSRIDHFVILIVLVAVVDIGIFYSNVSFRAKWSKIELELKADRNVRKKKEPESTSSSSSDKPMS